MKNICKRLLLIFNKSVFWSWNFILNLLWKTYFMCLLLSDCTNTVVNRLTTSYILTKFLFCRLFEFCWAKKLNWVSYLPFPFYIMNHKKMRFLKNFWDQVYSNIRVPTQVNTNQHESTRVWHESTRINTSQHESDTSQHESKTSQHESDRSQHESPQVKKCPRWVNMTHHKSGTSLTQVNLSYLTFNLLLELGINNKLQEYLDAYKIFINLSFLVKCLHSVHDSYRVDTYFVSDMPAVLIGRIFASDRECEEILF